MLHSPLSHYDPNRGGDAASFSHFEICMASHTVTHAGTPQPATNRYRSQVLALLCACDADTPSSLPLSAVNLCTCCLQTPCWSCRHLHCSLELGRRSSLWLLLQGNDTILPLASLVLPSHQAPRLQRSCTATAAAAPAAAIAQLRQLSTLLGQKNANTLSGRVY